MYWIINILTYKHWDPAQTQAIKKTLRSISVFITTSSHKVTSGMSAESWKKCHSHFQK